MTMEITHLTRDDIENALRLSKQAGWNQCRADWRRLVDLYPDQCFAGVVNGELVATSTLATYGGAVGWVGMILVDENHRRQGYGTQLLDRALMEAEKRNTDVVGLDATTAGKPLYRDREFKTVGEINRWSGIIHPPQEARAVTAEASEDNETLYEFDAAVCGIDRSALLRHLLSSSDVTGLIRESSEVVRGYAIVRPGRTHWQIGPVVSMDRETAAELFAAAADHVGDDSVLVDAVADDATTALFQKFGLTVQRSLSRMIRHDERDILNAPHVIATAGFEWG